jgi:chaperonin GroEL
LSQSAWRNAASIAGLLLVTEAMVADIPKKDPPPPPAPGGMDGMY